MRAMDAMSQDETPAGHLAAETVEIPIAASSVGLFSLLAIPKTERRKRDSG